MAPLVECSTLRDYCSALFAKVGVPSADARTVAASLVEADLRGVSSHGVTRVGIYLERLRGGVVNPRPSIRRLREGPGAALLDGDNGLGAVVGGYAMAEAVRRAETCGTAWVCVRNSNHFGTAAWYAMQALQTGCIGIALTSAPPTMPIWGGRSPFFGTNPFAVAVPAGKERSIVVDMATSVTARGKIILAAKKGEPIPDGLAIDPDGRPTTDARLALAGAVLPFGGHKGSAIALLVEVLSAVLAGASMAPHVGNLYDNPTGVQDIGHGFGAIRIEAFAPLAEFTARMDQLIREARQSPCAHGADRIYMPGEIEFDNAARNAARGLALPDVTVEDLRIWGERLGVAWPFAGTNARNA